MTTKTIRHLDPQGRINLPGHIRKALNLNTGQPIEVVYEDGTIRMAPAGERCSICGESVEGKHHTDVTIGPNEKHICYNCAQSVAKAMMR